MLPQDSIASQMEKKGRPKTAYQKQCSQSYYDKNVKAPFFSYKNNRINMDSVGDKLEFACEFEFAKEQEQKKEENYLNEKNQLKGIMVGDIFQ